MGIIDQAFESIGKEIEEIPPIYTIDLEDEEVVQEWGKRLHTALKMSENYQARSNRQHSNIMAYKGYYYNGPEPVVGGGSRLTHKRERFPRVAIAHTQDLVDQKVSKLMKVKVDATVIAATNEYNDKLDALATEKILTHISYLNDMETKRIRFIRRAVMCGEAFIMPIWDKTMGCEHAGSKKKKKAGEKVPLLGDDGKVMLNDEGHPIHIEETIRVGDVAYRMPYPWNILLVPDKSNEKVEIVLHEEYVHYREAQARWPEKASKIVPEQISDWFDAAAFDYRTLKDHVQIVHVYIRSSQFVDGGLHFSFTPTILLDEPEELEIPIDGLESTMFGNIPIERLTDIDVDTEIHGWPSMNNILLLQSIYDQIYTSMAMHTKRYCSPKWFVPRNGVNARQLEDGQTIVEWQGASPPQLATFPVITQDQFKLLEYTKGEMEQVFGIFSQSRGAPPPGTRATSSLLFYDEQEEERSSNFRKKFEAFIVALTKKTLSLISEKYDDGDERIVRILGEDKRWMAETFRVESLKKPYDIRVQVSSALPDNKYARIRTLLEVNQMAPGLFSPPQFIDMLDFGQHEKFITYAQAAIQCAEAEFESLQKTGEIEEPQKHEDLIAHWMSHAKFFQNFGFRSLPKDIQEKAMDHMGGTEFLMMEKGTDNEAFFQRLQQLDGFPLFLVMSEPTGIPGTSVPPAGPQEGAQTPPMPMPGGPGPESPGKQPQQPQEPGAL